VKTYKRGDWFWLDTVVDDVRHRVPLNTTDWRKVSDLVVKKIEELKKLRPDSTKRVKAYGVMSFREAVDAYIAERRRVVSPGMVKYWKAQSPPLVAHFKTPLKKITLFDITAYQNKRLDEGRAPKTFNGEISVLRQVLKHARLWYRFEQDYKPVPNDKPPVGRALTLEELKRLFETAALWESETPLIRVGKDGKTYHLSRAGWQYAHAAATLGAYCGMRSVEIRGLQWKHVDFAAGVLEIRRSKTPAGWRTPTLNQACTDVLTDLHASASAINATEPDHYVFPWQGGIDKIDPTKPMAGWRSAWRSILKEAGVKARFHDLRHTAVTTLAEAGMPDLTIMAQVGHISPEMMKHYSHIRRQALNQAAAALQPNYSTTSTTVEMVN
jgi:integrase